MDARSSATTSARRRPRVPQRVLAGALALVVAACVASCTDTRPHGEQLYSAARQANLLFKETVGAVLIHLSDGTWQVQEYGDLPVDCGAGYGFSLHRTTYEGWTLDADAATTADRIARWLADRGWTTSAPERGSDGRVVVEASDPAVAVAMLAIEIRDGEGTADAIGVGATSDCFDGDPRELTAILYPGWPDDTVTHEPLPVSEPAGARPVFGFTADGRPR